MIEITGIPGAFHCYALLHQILMDIEQTTTGKDLLELVFQQLVHTGSTGDDHRPDIHVIQGVRDPMKEHTMRDIETLITHFLGVSWGPVIEPGEGFSSIESSKGAFGFYLISDGGTTSYRTRARTPSFAHMQMLRTLSRGLMIPDLMAILGAMDFVLADIDR